MALEPIDVIPRYAFWQEGCRTLAVNVCAALREAGEPVIPRTVLAFVDGLPRDSYDLHYGTWQKSFCGLCLEKIHAKCSEHVEPLLDYFMNYFVERDSHAKAMLIEAFRGIIGGLNLDDVGPSHWSSYVQPLRSPDSP